MSDIDWDGQGLPPVGTVCDIEVYGSLLSNRTIEVYLNEDGAQDVIYSFLNSWGFEQVHKCDFIKRKTEKEKAVEAVSSALQQSDIEFRDGSLLVASKLYDLGLRLNASSLKGDK